MKNAGRPSTATKTSERMAGTAEKTGGICIRVVDTDEMTSKTEEEIRKTGIRTAKKERKAETGRRIRMTEERWSGDRG